VVRVLEGFLPFSDRSPNRRSGGNAQTQEILPNMGMSRYAYVQASYRGSAEEASDVLSVYEKGKGDMDVILEEIMCSIHTDDERFAAIIQAAIDEGRVKAFPAFTRVYGASGGKRRAARRGERAGKAASEAAEAEAMLEEMKKAHAMKSSALVSKGGSSLADMIRANARGRGDALAALERKYTGGKGKKEEEEEKRRKTKRRRRRRTSVVEGKERREEGRGEG
jgi:DnaJ family protein C protein 9